MSFLFKDLLVKIAIHAGCVFLGKLALYHAVTESSGYNPACPPRPGAIMDSIKP